METAKLLPAAGLVGTSFDFVRDRLCPYVVCAGLN
jgi:hypothetical protein